MTAAVLRCNRDANARGPGAAPNMFGCCCASVACGHPIAGGDAPRPDIGAATSTPLAGLAS